VNLVFLDAGYLLSIELVNDQDHARALAHWQQTSRDGHLSFVTTTFVFNEVVTYLNSRRLHAKACEIGERLRNSDNVDFHTVDERLFEQAWPT